MMQRKEILVYKSRDSCYLFRFFPTTEDIANVQRQAKALLHDKDLDFNELDYIAVTNALLALCHGTGSGTFIY